MRLRSLSWKSLVLCVLVITGKILYAYEIEGLYAAKVALRSQSDQEIRAAQRAAFSKVLIKVSGLSAIVDEAIVKQALRNSGQYLSQFTFLIEDHKQMLQADFDEGKVNDLILRTKKGVWGKHRPQALVWLVVDDGFSKKRHLLTASESKEYGQLINQVAESRGLPVIFPLWDIEDTMSLSINDVWGQFDQTILEASKRYQVDTIILARLRFNPELSEWIGEWRFFVDRQWTFGQKTDIEPDTILQQMMNQYGDQLGSKFAVNLLSEGKQRIHVRISNLQSLESYAHLMEYLNSLTIVESAQLVTIEKGTAEVAMTILGTYGDLVEAAVIDKRLVRLFDPVIKEQLSATDFEWNP